MPIVDYSGAKKTLEFSISHGLLPHHQNIHDQSTQERNVNDDERLDRVTFPLTAKTLTGPSQQCEREKDDTTLLEFPSPALSYNFYHSFSTSECSIYSKHISTACTRKKKKTTTTSDEPICLTCHEIYDTKDCYLSIVLGDLLSSSFQIEKVLGQGTFGTVLACLVLESSNLSKYRKGDRVAIKVIRAIPKYRRAAMTEISILQHLTSKLEKTQLVVELLGWFESKHHICMIFPLHSMDLYQYLALSHQRRKSIPFQEMQRLAYQLLKGLFEIHSAAIIHTDLKPENILITNPLTELFREGVKINMKIIDFGNAVHAVEHHSEVISTRHYRAPEVILGLKDWGKSADIWSLGCILLELYTHGTVVFHCNDDWTHLAGIDRLLSCEKDWLGFPQWMVAVDHPLIESFYLDHTDRLRVKLPKVETKDSLKSLDLIQPLSSLFSETYPDTLFKNLIQDCLKLDPHERMTAGEALSYPFFHYSLS